MLRWIQALRITLVVVGLCLLALWPVSYGGMPVLRTPLPNTNGAAVAFERGIAMIGVDFTGPRHRRGIEHLEASLVLRRRRGRGFEVEAKDGGAVSTADS